MATNFRTIVLALLAVSMAAACASPPVERRAASRNVIVEAAKAQVGAPYRYGGTSSRGFDCSGLVLYSYAKAGVSGLPHSASALERLSTPVSLRELEEGDLLFFQLAGGKTSHVGIYVGDRQFVHAPSSGKRVEQVSFDHVYWRKKLNRAGRIVR